MSADPETMFGSTGRDWRKAAGPEPSQAESNLRRPPAASGSAERLSQKSLSRPPEGSTRGHAKEPVEELGYGRCDPEASQSHSVLRAERVRIGESIETACRAARSKQTAADSFTPYGKRSQNALSATALEFLLSAEIPGVNALLSLLELKEAACCCAVRMAVSSVPQYALSQTVKEPELGRLPKAD